MSNQTETVEAPPTPIAPQPTEAPIADKPVKPARVRRASKSKSTLDLEVFNANIAKAVDGVETFKAGEQSLDSKGAVKTNKAGEALTRKSTLQRIASKDAIKKANPNATDEEIATIIRNAGKQLKGRANTLNALAHNDDAIICTSIQMGATTYRPTYKRIDKEDLATSMMVRTGAPLEECKRFVAKWLKSK